MNDQVFVSIIMAAYNAAQTIKQSINSVLSQSYADFELIVVNDCSSDKTREIVVDYTKKDNRVRLINNKKNSGVSISRHNGLINSKGAWIAVLDSDDLWAPDKLKKQIDFVVQTSAKLVFTGSTYISNDGTSINWIFHVPTQISYKSLLKQNFISNSSVLVEKSLYSDFESIGDQMHEDFACWLKILRSGIMAYGIDEPLLVYRIAKKSKSGNKKKSAIMAWRTYRYIGLGLFQSFYYLMCYGITGIIKYYHINKNINN